MPVKLAITPETQHRALKLRIYPTKEQEILINKTFGCCRQIFNNRLFERCMLRQIRTAMGNENLSKAFCLAAVCQGLMGVGMVGSQSKSYGLSGESVLSCRHGSDKAV